MNFTNEALNFMSSIGLPLHYELIADGKIHRYCKNKTSKKDEWYFARWFENQLLVSFGSWTDDSKHIYKSWTNENVPSCYNSEQVQKEYIEELHKIQHEASVYAETIWKEASECNAHPYLTRKKVKSYGVRVYKNHLIIPIYDYKQKLTSIQYIDPEGNKRFLSGGKIKGCWYVLGDLSKADVAYLAEGYATAASIFEATDVPVIIAFSASQLLPVASLVQDDYPNLKIFNARDLGSIAEKQAEKLKEIGVETFSPLFTTAQLNQGCKDFNDLFCAAGKEALITQLKIPFITTLDFVDFLEVEAAEPVQIVENLIHQGTYNVIYGESGIGKSRFSYSLANALAIGRGTFLKRKITKKLKVTYIDSEMTDTEIKKYLIDTLDGYQGYIGKPDPSNLNIVSHSMMERQKMSINLFDPSSLIRLDKIMEQTDVIFLDNFTHLTHADEDIENQAHSLVHFSNWQKKWCSLGKTIFLIHHANASGTKMRGTTRLSIEPRIIVRLEKPHPEESNTLNLVLSVVFEKARHLKAVDRLSITAEWNPCPTREPWDVKPSRKKIKDK